MRRTGRTGKWRPILISRFTTPPPFFWPVNFLRRAPKTRQGRRSFYDRAVTRYTLSARPSHVPRYTASATVCVCVCHTLVSCAREKSLNGPRRAKRTRNRTRRLLSRRHAHIRVQGEPRRFSVADLTRRSVRSATLYATASYTSDTRMCIHIT